MLGAFDELRLNPYSNGMKIERLAEAGRQCD